MKRLFNLLLLEISQYKLLFLVLISSLFGFQCYVVFKTVYSSLQIEAIQVDAIYPLLEINVDPFSVTKALGFGILLTSCHLIWNHDWSARNGFMTRLLMTPGPRMHIYFAKLGVHLCILLAIPVIQFVAITFGLLMMGLFIPDLSLKLVFDAFIANALSASLPSMSAFVVSLVIYVAGISTCFQNILIKASSKRYGNFIVVLAVVANIALFLGVWILYARLERRLPLTTEEILLLKLFLSSVFIGINWLGSNYLLEHSVGV